MLFCQLAQAKSLRKMCSGLSCCLGKLRHLGFKKAPNKSTLYYANAHRAWQMYQELFYQTQGYNYYKLFSHCTENFIYFVTRLKDKATCSVVKDRDVPQNRNILSDQIIQFNGYYAHKDCQHILRKVVVWDKGQNRKIVLLTNHLDFGATTISAIYKDRWQIELILKDLKQNLKVKTLVGTSENAFLTALIAMLLIKYLQFKYAWSLSNLVVFLRWNLFTYRELWGWIDDPFEVLPITTNCPTFATINRCKILAAHHF